MQNALNQNHAEPNAASVQVREIRDAAMSPYPKLNATRTRLKQTLPQWHKCDTL